MSDRKRVVLLHAYYYSMEPISRAFADVWPEAEIINMFDESLYADLTTDGVFPPGIDARVTSLFLHCELSGAEGIVFTGSSFGPVVERTRHAASVPVLKSDEAAAEYAVASAQSILVLSTARRALPVLLASVEAAAKQQQVERQITGMVVPGAKDAIERGDLVEHDRLIVEFTQAAGAFDAIIFGQVSMEPALTAIPPELAQRIITTPRAAAMKMRSLLSPSLVAETG